MNEAAHGFIVAFILLGYTFIIYKTKPYTYDRANVFQTAIILISSMICLFSTIASFFGSNLSYVFLGIIVLISLTIAAYSMWLMKKYYPKYLKQDPIDTTILFRFAYRCDSKVSMLDKHLQTQKIRVTRLTLMKSSSSISPSPCLYKKVQQEEKQHQNEEKEHVKQLLIIENLSL